MYYIKENKLLLDHFFYFSSDLMCVIGTDGFCKHVNPSFIKLLGLNQETILKASFYTFIHPDDREVSYQRINSYVEGDMYADNFENRFITNSGEIKWLSWKLISFIEEGLIYGIAHDITESKKIKSEMDDHRNKLLQIIDLVPHPIFLKDKIGKYTLVNQAQANLFFTSKNDLLGKDDSHFIKNPEELASILESDHIVLTEKKSIALPEQIITHIDGKRRILHTTKIPFLSNYDGEMSILGISIDMTDIKNAENELRKINFELDSFVYHSSHDLRAPLCSLTGLLNLIKLEKDPLLKDKCVEEAKKSIKRLDGFISDLTDLSRNSRLSIKPEKINFNKIIQSTFDHLKYMQSADKISVKVDIIENEPFYSDKKRLKIIFMNLISNAIKYQSTEASIRPEININLHINKENVIIKIKDNGIGIEKDLQFKIFEMFFRASENSVGSGLGLYIVKQILEKMNSTISLDSEIGKGSEFRITIPNSINLNSYSS
jgi:PAS domain S-box-containing protein